MTARMKDGTVMTRAIIGKKIGMTQVWSDDDRLIPVTVVEAGPCVVSQVKTKKSDGYDAIQIAYGDVRANKVNKPMQGHFAKAGVDPRRYVAEVRLDETPEFKSGDTLTVEMFEVGAKVHVSGTSKGKGFAGVIKRHNFSGGPASHGSHLHRSPGAIGQASTPSRVFKGKKMPGRMGGESVTVRNLEVVRTDPEQNLLLIRGAVPGGKNAILMIRNA
jgi:large subunit ribosomal protein L3